MVNELIRKYRQKAGLTQQQVADKLFVQKQTYNQYETGKRKIDAELFLKIAEIINMNITIRERYRRANYPNFDDLLPRIKYYKMNKIKEDKDGIYGFKDFNINSITQVIFFIDGNPFMYIEKHYNNGPFNFDFIHLSHDFLYQEKKEALQLLFQTYGKTFEMSQYSIVCPFCNKYKKSMYDLDFNREEFHVCIPLEDWEFRNKFMNNMKNMNAKQFLLFEKMKWGLNI